MTTTEIYPGVKVTLLEPDSGPCMVQGCDNDGAYWIRTDEYSTRMCHKCMSTYMLNLETDPTASA